MNIQLNGKRTTVPAATTVGDLVRKKDLDPAAVVVEHNLTILTATDLDQVTLKENDTLEILRFVGGG
jgi:sulfur carrier protein